MSRKRTALVTAGIAAGAVAGGVIGRTVLNARRRQDPEADERLSELPPEDLGPVRSFDGTELAVRAAGDPSQPTIVFVHGFSLDMTTWHYQWTGLSDRFRCVLFDFRSHGRSARAAGGDLSPQAFGHDLAAVLRAVGDKRVLLVGHSMGAMSMLALAERNPSCSETRSRAWCSSARPRAISFAERSARSPSSASEARIAAAGCRSCQPAPAVRLVEPRRRRPDDRSRDAVRSGRIAPPRALRRRARRARAVRGLDRRFGGVDGDGSPPCRPAHRRSARSSSWASRIG